MASKEHKDLANVIKDVHVKLRKSTRQHGFKKAWLQHVAKSEELSKYATAMHKLATEHWDKSADNVSRIRWVILQCEQYFHKGGREKSEDRERVLYRKYFECDCPSVTNVRKNTDDSKLTLLDVGSCFNPFKGMPKFNVFPVDLAPATGDVLKCDFLNVNVTDGVSLDEIENPCTVLPECSFDVVVFSLLLEYIPCKKQRWICCQKAYRLLKFNGVFIIVTPDSKHATANSRLIKNWRYAMATLGMLLVNYEKVQHLHCIVYRKCFHPEVSQHWLTRRNVKESIVGEDMISIPQDTRDYAEEQEEEEEEEKETADKTDSVKAVERSEIDRKFIADNFHKVLSSEFDLF